MNSQDNFQKQYDAIAQKVVLANSYGSLCGKLGGTFGNNLGYQADLDNWKPFDYYEKTYKPVITEHFLECAGIVYQVIRPNITFEEYIESHLQEIKISA